MVIGYQSLHHGIGYSAIVLKDELVMSMEWSGVTGPVDGRGCSVHYEGRTGYGPRSRAGTRVARAAREIWMWHDRRWAIF